MTHNTFSIKEAVSFGWQTTKSHYWFLLKAGFIGALLLGAAASTGVVAPLAMLILTLAAIAFTLEMVDGKHPTLRTALTPFATHHKTWQGLLATLLYLVGAAILTALLMGSASALVSSLVTPLATSQNAALIQGVSIAVLLISLWLIIYISVRLKFYIYAIVDKDMKALDSLGYSRDITQGVFWKLVGFNLILAAINILGAIPLGLGLFITIPWTLLSYGHVYRILSKHHTPSSGPHIA